VGTSCGWKWWSVAKPRRDRVLMERALVDAAVLGDEKAAKKNRISVRTLHRYKAVARDDAELTTAVTDKRRELSMAWLEDAKAARAKALARGLALAETSDNLRDVTGFLKIVHDAVLADEMLNGAEVDDDEQHRRGNGMEGSEGSDRQVPGGAETH
jgi:hypothetical protein